MTDNCASLVIKMTHKQKRFEVRTKLIDTIDERKCVQHDDGDYTHSGHRPLRIDVGASVDPPLYHHYINNNLPKRQRAPPNESHLK